MSRWHASADIPATIRGPTVARGFVAALLNARGLEHLTYQAQLVISELVTNAYQHAPGTDSFELELSATDKHIRISLADGSAIRPTVAELNQDAPRGRGMRIVQNLASRWGADDHHGGKRVWAEIAIT
jgi:anti-sigma regulatory factor (Ser/Thr protein kinase)